MFSAIRNFVFVVCLLLLGAVGTSFWLYGSVEPCRMLARELSRDTIRDVSEAFGTTEESLEMWDETAEQTFRIITSQYSSGQCFDRLSDIWWQKISG